MSWVALVAVVAVVAELLFRARMTASLWLWPLPWLRGREWICTVWRGVASGASLADRCPDLARFAPARLVRFPRPASGALRLPSALPHPRVSGRAPCRGRPSLTSARDRDREPAGKASPPCANPYPALPWHVRAKFPAETRELRGCADPCHVRGATSRSLVRIAAARTVPAPA